MPEMPPGAKGPTLDCTDLQCPISGDTATCTTQVHVISEGNLSPLTKLIIWPVGYKEGSPLQESLQLAKVGNEWKIIAAEQGNRGYLNYVATLSRYYTQMGIKAKENSCLSNVRQIGQACRMALSDTNDQFLLKAENYEEWVWAYLKNEALFHCPLSTQPAVRSYMFNPALIGLSAREIAGASKTVMLYEGKRDALEFRHQGRAGVVFVDGQTQMVTESEAKALIWTP